ncbi:MAG: hypothetical protein MJ072_07085 [Clostridia bacterium]|nr:hypothetical protein [Clostridia bacterium]
MSKAYTVADVVVSRCGSNSAFEILSLKIPAVFIPLPKGESRGDQEENAEYFLRAGIAQVLRESSLTKESLLYAVLNAYANRYNVRNNQRKITDASPKIAEKIISVAKGNLPDY